jgi:hypothetical protein
MTRLSILGSELTVGVEQLKSDDERAYSLGCDMKYHAAGGLEWVAPQEYGGDRQN